MHRVYVGKNLFHTVKKRLPGDVPVESRDWPHFGSVTRGNKKNAQVDAGLGASKAAGDDGCQVKKERGISTC